MAETALAAPTVTATWTSPGEVATNTEFSADSGIETTWSYCVQEDVYMDSGVAYEYSLVDVANYPAFNSELGYSAAWLIYDAYNAGMTHTNGTTAINTSDQHNLQENIWDVFKNGTSYYSSYHGLEQTLSNLFDIVVTEDVASHNGHNYTQDLIIYNPGGLSVPVPASLWLLGSGLSGLLVLRRKKK